MFSVHKDVLVRAMTGAYCRDERSGFLFPTNPKYVHLGFGILRRSNCAIPGIPARNAADELSALLFPVRYETNLTTLLLTYADLYS